MSKYSEFEYIEGFEELPCGHEQYLYVESGGIVDCGTCGRRFRYSISIVEISHAQPNDTATLNTRIGGDSADSPKPDGFANSQDVSGNGGKRKGA
jgi:hypothetical protein